MRSLLLSPVSRARFVVRFYRILRARVINSAGLEKTSVLFFLACPVFCEKELPCLEISIYDIFAREFLLLRICASTMRYQQY